MLKQKYKDREPTETINIVKNFFEKNGYKIRLYPMQTSINTFSCHLDLYYDDTFIAYSNGKGMSWDFAFASGYAELYERFCSKMYYSANNTFFQQIKKQSLESNGYVYSKDEKILKKDEVLSLQSLKNFYNTLSNNHEDFLETILYEAIGDNNATGLPYKNIVDDNILYIDPRVLYRMVGSTGLAAGNDFYEAFNQGFSEILERYASLEFIHNRNLTLHRVNLKNIKNQELQERIELIFKTGHDFYLYDLSYNFNIPVVIGILIDRQAHFSCMSLGSFPVFDIAVERVITEMYQNLRDFNSVMNDRIQTSYKNYNSFDLTMNTIRNINYIPMLPDTVYFNSIDEEYHNKEVYLSENHNNEEIYKYYLDLIKKFNWDVYCYDHSLCKELLSIQIVCDNLVYYPELKWDNLNTEQDNDILREIIELYYNLNYYLNYSSNYNYKDIERLVARLQDLHYVAPDFSVFIGADWLFPYHNVSAITICNLMNDLLSEEKWNNITDYKYTFFYSDLKKYKLLEDLVVNGYQMSEIETISQVLGFTVTEDDISNINNVDYILNKIYFEKIYNILHSQNYISFINTFIKRAN